MKPFLSAVPNHSAERSFRLFCDMPISLMHVPGHSTGQFDRTGAARPAR
jgi:hypothetical protein